MIILIVIRQKVVEHIGLTKLHPQETLLLDHLPTTHNGGKFIETHIIECILSKNKMSKVQFIETQVVESTNYRNTSCRKYNLSKHKLSKGQNSET